MLTCTLVNFNSLRANNWSGNKSFQNVYEKEKKEKKNCINNDIFGIYNWISYKLPTYAIFILPTLWKD